MWSNGNKTITITLKGWKFGDGQAVDAQSVIFWLNMLQAESGNWAGTAPGANQWPGNIKSYSAPNGATGDTVVINLDRTYSTTWFQYNELSQIDPMAEAWDVTSLTAAAGSGGCGAVSKTAGLPSKAVLADCVKVWTFDTDNNGAAKHPQMAGDLATYASNPLWAAGASGPWKLSAFDASTGQSTFVPNPTYSGPQKPYLSSFIEVPYTSDTAEYNALAAGGSTAPDLGYLPSQNTPQKPAGLGPTQAGPNDSALSSSYSLTQTESWQINYFPENFNSTLGAGGHAGAVFKQLYFRQALQELVDQTGVIATYFKGYGVPTYGPAPVYPPNNFAHGVELKTGGPYPFSLTTAVATLKAHGWNVVPNGTTTCKTAGTGASGLWRRDPGRHSAHLQGGLRQRQRSRSPRPSTTRCRSGQRPESRSSSSPQPFDNVLKAAVSCYPTATSACHAWDMANWGGGWLFSPDYLPTGEEIFATGAGSNQGDYSDPTND